MQKNRTRVGCTALAVIALAALGLAGGASAKLTKEFTKFQQCAYTNVEVRKCIYSTTEGGEVVLGNKKVPIVNPVVLQGGYTKATAGFAKFVGAVNGISLSKAAQPIPGGLLGIVPPEKSGFLVKALSKFFFENALTGVNSTLELAKPASEIRVSESHLAEEEEVALKMPVMVHLENPFLGKSCYVGSTGTPLNWELTAGSTSPPLPNTSITGSAGEIKFLEEGSVLVSKNASLVDNAWSAPTASGCGGIISFLVNPIINAQLGTTTAGHNTAILKNTIYIGAAAAVKENNAENP